jgi:hypothetical protein
MKRNAISFSMLEARKELVSLISTELSSLAEFLLFRFMVPPQIGALLRLSGSVSWWGLMLKLSCT